MAAYITRVRMRTAMKLLNDCRNKVYEVAEQVGYRDVAHFSSSFKRIVGVTPPNTRIEACKTQKMHKRNDKISEKLYIVSEILK